MNGFAERIVSTTVSPTTIGETVSMRRIIKERRNAFDTGTSSDNNHLYFCGFTSRNSDDMLFGRISSNNVNSGAPSITVDIIFEYGSPNSEYSGRGDCALTADNNYLIGVFSTNHGNTRSVSDIITSYTVSETNPGDWRSAKDPYICIDLGGCNIDCTYNNDYANMFTVG